MRIPAGLLALTMSLGCTGGAPAPTRTYRAQVAPFATTTALVARQVTGPALLAEPTAAISLTASDGAGLALTRLTAEAVVDGPLAFTELHLEFDNPEDRVREGRFAITLPDGASVSRFAMEIDGRWMEAEMVEKQAARRAYEDFLHRRQDPALLEKEAGNEFTARVFPIPARGRKRIILSYAQELPDTARPYVLPLRGLPAIGEVAARVRVAGAAADGSLAFSEAALAERDWQPDRDLAVARDGGARALGGDGVVAMAVTPALPAAPDAVGRAVILVDTSASRGAGYAGYARAVEDVVAALGRAEPGLHVTVAAFDQEVEEVFAGAAAQAAGAVAPRLVARAALGASDLGAALAWAGGRAPRVIVVGDAVSTAGVVEAGALGASVATLAGVERLDVVLAGGLRDRAAAETVARSRLARDGAVLDLDAGADEVARRLRLATRSGIAVTVDGATAVWPARLDGVQAGDAAMVYAWFPRTPREVTVRLDAAAATLPVTPAVGPLVTRAAAQAELARREAALGELTDPAARAAAEAAIVALSIEHRVLSDRTALLVLETEDDYRRFGIDRRALAGIVAVTASGVEVLRRDDAVWMAVADAADGEARKRDAAADKDVVEKKKTAGAPGGAREEARLADDAAQGEAAWEAGAVAEAEPARGGGAAAATGAAARPSAPPPEPQTEAPRRARTDGDDEIVDGYLEGLTSRDDGGASDARPAANLAQPDDVVPRGGPAPVTGPLAEVQALVAAGKLDDALARARAWRAEEPGDVLALVGLGEALEAARKLPAAARAYGSIVDLFPGRADLRRFAAARLDRVAAGFAPALALAIDAYRKAVEQRPDHLTGHHQLVMALLRAGRAAEAFEAAERGLGQRYPQGRFAGGEQVLREDLGLAAAAWRRAEPRRADEIARRLAAAGGIAEVRRSTRFLLTWETDANDVDFHIRDARGGHAYYRQPELASGGRLYADVTTGYGPECFTIRGTPTQAPYDLSIHYYSRGPMGYGMGSLLVVRHDGHGALDFETRPFVVMADGAYVDLGAVR